MIEKLRRWRNIIIVIGCFFLLGYLQRGLEAIIPDNASWNWGHEHRIYLIGAITIAIAGVLAILEARHNKRSRSGTLITFAFLLPFIFLGVMIVYPVFVNFIKFEKWRNIGFFEMFVFAYIFLIYQLEKLKEAVDSNTGKLVETHEMINRKLSEIDSSIRERNFYEGD